MSKFLFLFLLMASIYFVGCQSSDNLTTPQELDKPVPTPLVWGDPTPGTSVYTVDLVKGQHDVVGNVDIEKVGNDLQITYEVSAPACELTEVHVDIAKSLGTTPITIDFNVNSQGSPNFGNWDTKTLGTINISNPTSVVVYFTEAQLKLALGVSTIPAKIYIGIHGVVECGGLGGDYCPQLTGNTLLHFSGMPGDYDYYMQLLFATPVINGLTTLYGWCLDPSRMIHDSDCPLYLNFLCSYDLGALSCVVDHPENLDAANWLINNKGTFTKYQVQGALWTLLSNNIDWYTLEPLYYASDYMAAVNAALQNGEGFRPGCGQKVLIIGYNQEGNDPNPCLNITKQVIAFEVDANCVTVGSGTVMGFNYPPDASSSLFPGSQWFRYISLNY